ncbi:hypothetical protein JTB14_018556 [Gonioctena quinquepunctata]|nr:hypothetical protein JTB14_018556 [Gonioctena quinquepunctata]
MSFSNENVRPKLKAKRFNKFESSTERNPTADTSNDTERQQQQRFKRRIEDTFEEPSHPKKFCSGIAFQPPSTKNLANARLQKLKEFLKTDRKQSSSNNENSQVDRTHLLKTPKVCENSQRGPESSKGKSESSETRRVAECVYSSQSNTRETKEDFNRPSNAIPRTNLVSNEYNRDSYGQSNTRETKENFNRPSNAIPRTNLVSNEYNRDSYGRFDESRTDEQYTPETTSNSIYKNLDKWASPPESTPQKNFANNRLQRLKHVVKDLKPKDLKKIATNEEPKHQSPLLRYERTAVKRNIGATESSPEFTPTKRLSIDPFSPNPTYSNKESPRFAVPDTQLSEKLFKGENSKSKTSTPATPISKRLNINRQISHTPDTNFNLPVPSSSPQKVYPSPKVQSLHRLEKATAYDSFQSENSKAKTSTPATPISKRLNLNRQITNRTPIDSHTPNTNFKLPVPSPSPQKEFPSPNVLSLAENSDHFNGKMAMTATWIRNNQIMSGIQPDIELMPKPSETSQVVGLEETLEDGTEEMEWTNAEPDLEIMGSDQKIIGADSNVVKGVEKQSEKLKDLCIVVDTNVFISGLSKIKDIISMKLSGPIQPVLFIPWMVITELDYMKLESCDERLRQKVSNAIKLINTLLKEKNPRFIGQTVYEMEKQKLVGKSPDDKIMSCCLQVAEKYETVILLSNDLNLKSKAMINGVTACSANEIIMKIMSKVTKNTKTQKVMQKMSILCSSVICECAKETYGEVWSKMDMLSCPPWSLVDCLKRFKKYWGTVFKDKVMKQFTKCVDDLLQLFNSNKYFGDESADFVNFMKLCINLCIFLKDIEEFRGSVENTLADITKLG